MKNDNKYIALLSNETRRNQGDACGWTLCSSEGDRLVFECKGLLSELSSHEKINATDSKLLFV